MIQTPKICYSQISAIYGRFPRKKLPTLNINLVKMVPARNMWFSPLVSICSGEISVGSAYFSNWNWLFHGRFKRNPLLLLLKQTTQNVTPPSTLHYREKSSHQWQGHPKGIRARFVLKRGHCISSSWFAVRSQFYRTFWLYWRKLREFLVDLGH